MVSFKSLKCSLSFVRFPSTSTLESNKGLISASIFCIGPSISSSFSSSELFALKELSLELSIADNLLLVSAIFTLIDVMSELKEVQFRLLGFKFSS